MSFQAMNWAMEVNRSGLLKSAEAFVLLVLANYADEEWSCFPSQERLAGDTAQGKRTVVRQVKRLQELGLVVAEDRYGKGRGRIGNRYFLIKEAFEQLVDNRESERSANLALESENGMNTRSANLALESENGVIERSANLAPERLKCHPRHDSSAIHDISDQVPLKEHTRINHHHQSSPDVRDENANSDQTIDDDVDVNIYRGVDLGQLVAAVPGLSGYAHDMAMVRQAVDVVLGRARGRVAQPTAYVRKALSDDLYGVLGSVTQTPRVLIGASQAGGVPAFDAAVPEGQALRAARGSDDDGAALGLVSDDKWAVPQFAELSADAVPCTNLDHLQSYDMTARQLANCNYCRVEQKVQANDLDGGYPHVADATNAQIAGLPHRLQQWVAQFRASDIGNERVS